MVLTVINIRYCTCDVLYLFVGKDRSDYTTIFNDALSSVTYVNTSLGVLLHVFVDYLQSLWLLYCMFLLISVTVYLLLRGVLVSIGLSMVNHDEVF